MPWGRVNNLIDGVYGFSATLLMLNLSVPDYDEGQLGAALLAEVPEYLVYLLGFAQIIGAWSVLRRMSSWCVGIDYYGMLLAFLALAMWATTPFTLDLMSQTIHTEPDFTAAVRMLAVTSFVSMLGLLVPLLEAVAGGLLPPRLGSRHLPDREGQLPPPHVCGR